MKDGEEEEIPFEMRTKTLIQGIFPYFPKKVNLCGHLEQQKFHIHFHYRAALQPTQGKYPVLKLFHCNHIEMASLYDFNCE